MKIIGVVTKYILLIAFVMTTMTSGVSADTVSSLQGQQSSAQKKLDTNNDQLSKKITAVNQVYQEIQQLNEKKKDTAANITAVKEKLAAAKLEKQKRVADAKARLRELQLREGTNDTLQVLENSSNLSQWLGNVIALTRLQAVYNDSLAAVKQSVNKISTDRKQLVTYQASLDSQAKDLALKKDQMSASLSSLKQLVKNNQAAVATLANKVSWAKESAAKEAAAQASASSLAVQQQAQAATSSSSAQSATTSSSAAVSSQSSSSTTASSSSSANSATTTTATTATTATNVVSTGSSSKTLTMQSTGYSTAQSGLSSYSATGINLSQHPSCIAVDPSVIPLGSIVWVSGYGVTVAGDTGGAIKGNIIDVHFSTVAQAQSWGRRSVTVKILS
ncbi:MAG: 3D domain-containing protein [Liquorilactobacillus hordei]|uniref:3D domain-containing protein n=1 Tax=Liquorilactobacillus hordei TaxID=468911 RepID=UPI0039EB497C